MLAHKKRAATVTLLVGMFLLIAPVPVWAGGGGGNGGSACSGFSEGTRVLLRDNCFQATALFVPPGSTVTVRNDGAFPHSYTAVDGTFDTGVLDPGERAQVRLPEAPGVYRVYCTLHSSPRGEGMAGVLVVGAGELTAAAQDDADPSVVAAGGGSSEVASPSAASGWTVPLAAAALALAALALAVSLRNRGATQGVSG